jgi:hypothetical protein
LEENAATRQNVLFRAGGSANNKRCKLDTLKPANAASGEHKREFEQKVAKVTKGIRVGLGGECCHTAKCAVSRWRFSEQQEVQAGHSQTSERRQRGTQRRV